MKGNIPSNLNKIWIPVLSAVILIGLGIFTICSQQKERLKTVAQYMKEAEEVRQHKSFQLKNSGTFVEIDGKEIEITDHIESVADNDIFITETGMMIVFGLSRRDPTSEEKKKIAMLIKENDFLDDPQAYVAAFYNDEHTLIIKQGLKVCMADGKQTYLSNPITVTNKGNMSIPLSNIAFLLGYDGIKKEIQNNRTVYYLMRSGSEG